MRQDVASWSSRKGDRSSSLVSLVCLQLSITHTSNKMYLQGTVMSCDHLNAEHCCLHGITFYVGMLSRLKFSAYFNNVDFFKIFSVL